MGEQNSEVGGGGGAGGSGEGVSAGQAEPPHRARGKMVRSVDQKLVGMKLLYLLVRYHLCMNYSLLWKRDLVLEQYIIFKI